MGGHQSLTEHGAQSIIGCGGRRLIHRVCAHGLDEAGARDHRCHLLNSERGRHVRPEHGAVEGDMGLNGIGPLYRGRECRPWRAGMVGKADKAVTALAHLLHHIEADPFWRTRVGRGALHDAQGVAVAANPLDSAVERVRRNGNTLCVMQCTTAYPCPPERIGLNVMQEMCERYDSFVGLSDHSGTPWPAIAATVQGANAVEAHVTFDRAMFGPDVPASLTIEEMTSVVSGIRFVEAMRANPVDKAATAATYDTLRAMFSQGLVAAHDLPAGSLIGPDSLSTRKPLRGIPASQYDTVLGRTLRVAVPAGTPLEEAHLQAAKPGEVL